MRSYLIDSFSSLIIAHYFFLLEYQFIYAIIIGVIFKLTILMILKWHPLQDSNLRPSDS